MESDGIVVPSGENNNTGRCLAGWTAAYGALVAGLFSTSSYQLLVGSYHGLRSKGGLRQLRLWQHTGFSTFEIAFKTKEVSTGV